MSSLTDNTNPVVLLECAARCLTGCAEPRVQEARQLILSALGNLKDPPDPAQRVLDLYTLAEYLRLDVERQQESWRDSGLVRVSFEPDFEESVLKLTDGLEMLLLDVERAGENEDLRRRAFQGEEVAA